MRTTIVLLLIAWLAAGCRPDPAKKPALDQRVARIPASNATYGAPRPVMHQPKVGQWVQYKRTSRGETGLVTTKLVAQERGAYWIEMVMENYDGKTYMKMLVDFGDLKNPKTFKSLAMKMKDPKGQVMEYPPEMVKSLSQ
jgi:hypothetical protein